MRSRTNDIGTPDEESVMRIASHVAGMMKNNFGRLDVAKVYVSISDFSQDLTSICLRRLVNLVV
jgi:hypothetical protein